MNLYQRPLRPPRKSVESRLRTRVIPPFFRLQVRELGAAEKRGGAMMLATDGERPRTCRKCSASLPVGGRRGRPAAFCGRPCRRAAEFEVRRATRRLETIDVERSRLRINLDGGGQAAEAYPRMGMLDRPRFRAQLAALDREAVRLEARLKELLAAGASGPHE
jgi:hypothetical protein